MNNMPNNKRYRKSKSLRAVLCMGCGNGGVRFGGFICSNVGGNYSL